jgi:succinate-semialdehyde dehydrogenase/glutarate-semialdehyde dehydrogenase
VVRNHRSAGNSRYERGVPTAHSLFHQGGFEEQFIALDDQFLIPFAALETKGDLNQRELQDVVDDVASVQPFWAQLPLHDRARYMRRAGQAIIDQLDDLAALLAREQGKPINEAYAMELVPTIDSLRWLAEAGPGILEDERIPLPVFIKQKRARFTFEPLGVVGVIAPWNYPWSIPFGEVAVALMAGNGVVLKPASLTPLIGQRIQEVFERAGVPEGLVRTVHGGGAVGQALVESSAAKIFFTGSVEVGRRVGEECARRMKGSVLELGGKDPMIVCADANLPNAISGCLWGGFANAGQTCSGIERVYVVEEVAERFVEGVVEGAERLRTGDPLDWDTEIGPMVSPEQLAQVKELVDDAVAVGEALGAPMATSKVSARCCGYPLYAAVEIPREAWEQRIWFDSWI